MWVKKKIGEIGQVITGKTPSRDNPDQWGDFLCFVTPSDIPTGVKYIYNTERHLSEEGVNAFRKMLIPAGSILITCIGSDMGKVVINNADCVTNQQINSLIVDNEQYDGAYIFYCLRHLYPTLRAFSGGGSTMPILIKSVFENIEVKVPSEKLQQKSISDILSPLDMKIDVLQRQNILLKKIAKSIFNHWFLEFEFPNDAGEPYVSNGGKMVGSDLGAIPEGWVPCKFGDILDRINDRIGQDDQSTYVVLSAVKTGELVLSEEYFSKQVFSKDIAKYIRLQKDDFAYNPARINIGSIGKLEDDILGAVSPVYVAFRAKDNFTHFVSFLIKSEKTKRHIEYFANGSVRQALNYDDFAFMDIIKPPENVLNEFNETYECILKKIRANNQQIDTLSRMLEALMPKLLCGEIEVSD